MEIQVYKGEDGDIWNELCLKADNSTAFHNWAWLKTIEKHGGGKLHAIGFEKGEKTTSMIPFFIQKKAGLKLLFSPPGHTAVPYLGPAYVGYGDLKQSRKERLIMDFQSALEKHIKEEIRPDYVFVSTTPGFLDIRPWQWAGYTSAPHYDYSFDLTVGEDSLWNGLKKDLRSSILKAKNEGITIRKGDKKDFKAMIADLKARYIEQGIREHTSEKYLMDVFKSLYPDNMRVLVAEKDGERVGGMAETLHKETITSWIGGVRSTQTANANSLVQWEAIRSACAAGAKEYIELGANTKRIVNFKRKFNPTPQLYFNLRRYPNPLLKVVEKGYVEVIKPIRARVRGGGG